MLQLLSEHSRSSFIVYLYLTSTFYFVISQLFQLLLLPTFILVVVVDFLLLRMHTTRTHTLYSRTISGIWVCTQTHPPPPTQTHTKTSSHTVYENWHHKPNSTDLTRSLRQHFCEGKKKSNFLHTDGGGAWSGVGGAYALVKGKRLHRDKRCSKNSCFPWTIHYTSLSRVLAWMQVVR